MTKVWWGPFIRIRILVSHRHMSLIIKFDNDGDGNDDNNDNGNDDSGNYDDGNDDDDDNGNDDDHTVLSVLKEASHDWHLSKADGIDAPLLVQQITFSDFHSAHTTGPQQLL